MTDAPVDVIALRPFVPAADFETSSRFYVDLGFTNVRLADDLAWMKLGPFSFLLQHNAAVAFADHFTMHLLVRDVAAWWQRIAALDLAARYGVRAPIAPELQPWGLVVAFVFDPSGVLWHVAALGERRHATG